MKKKINLLSLSRKELSVKEKTRLVGGTGIGGCCCSGNGMVNTWGGVYKGIHP